LHFEPKFWPKPKAWTKPKPKPKLIPKPKFRPKPKLKPKPKISDHYSLYKSDIYQVSINVDKNISARVLLLQVIKITWPHEGIPISIECVTLVDELISPGLTVQPWWPLSKSADPCEGAGASLLTRSSKNFEEKVRPLKILPYMLQKCWSPWNHCSFRPILSTLKPLLFWSHHT
jgi:hypothetical protein